MDLKNYTIKEQIHYGANSRVFKGIKKSDKTPVIIKTLASEYPTQKEIDKFCNQYNIVKNIDIQGIIKSYELVKYKNSFVIVMEDIGGVDLKQLLNGKKLDIKTFLFLSIKLAGCLQEIHDNNIIHKDIKPDNIIVVDDYKDIRITDFSISTLLSQEKQSILNENLFSGTLSYISPEQTGRMNRAIDYRTDFYSLGITFYELITGDVPFHAEDALGMVHLHIAQMPVPPDEIDPSIPKPISNIIMKLQSKNAEDRYLSAIGLKKDLENCQKQFSTSGKIEDFTLAQNDYSSKFKISGKLYGRDKEIEILLNKFEQVSKGGKQILLASGYSGIGKSALIYEIYKPIVKHRGLFISGKYNQFKKNVPYSAIIQAFIELIHQLLRKSDKEIKIWKDKILEGIGNNGQVITNVIPLLELIIGKQPEVIKLGPVETQNRFKLIFQRFTRVFTKKEHPLTMFLDDLQWADTASLNLIKILVTDTDTESFLLLGAYRNNEITSDHPLILTLNEIKSEDVVINTLNLKPLSIINVNELISDSLECDKEKTHELTEHVYKKTNGNPFFVNEFLKTLHIQKNIEFDSSAGWIWNIEEIKKLKITDNVVDLLAGKIQELSEKTKEILKIASCIGNRFSLVTLGAVCEESKEDIKDLLFSVMQDDFIFFENEMYFFHHVRVQEAVYSLVSEEVKKKNHYRIGNLVLKNTREDELQHKVFYIVDQLNYGIELINNENEKVNLARLNLLAGIKAKESTAYEQSLKYLNIGIKLIDENWLQNQYELAISLYTNGAEAAYLNIDSDLMEKLADVVLNRATSLLDKVKVYEIKINAYASQHKSLEVVYTGCRILKDLGINLPKKPGKIDVIIGLIKTKLLLRGITIKHLKSLPVMTDNHKLAAMRILMSIISSVYYAMPDMLPVLAFKMIELTIKYGNSSFSGIAYSIYGIILCGVLNEIESGYQYGELAFQAIEDFDAKALRAKVQFSINVFIRHWKVHLKEILLPLLNGYKIALEVGDLEYAGLFIQVYFPVLLFTDKERNSINESIKIYSNILEQLKLEKPFNSIKVPAQYISNLIGNNKLNRHLLKGDIFDEDKMLPVFIKNNSNTDICAVYIWKLLLCFFFGKYDEAIENAIKAKKYLGSLVGLVHIPNYYFYYSLSLLASYSTLRKGKQKHCLKKVNKNQKKIEKWAKHAPMNHLHKYYLIEAEKARVSGCIKAAMDYYDKAIELAGDNEYINEQAVACECAAKFYIDQNMIKIAKLYIQESYYCYSRWGATEKVSHLEENYHELLINKSEEEKTKISSSSSTISTTSLDINTIIKASQTISGEIQLEKLLKKMMKIVIENAAAQKGILVLERNDKYYVEAQAILGKEDVVVMQSIPVEEYNEFSLQIIQYVLRSKVNFVSGDAVSDENCIDDEYIKEREIKSLLCFPIMHHNKLMALLYLENNLTVNAFTRNRLEILKSLSHQIAISLENARLYENLKEQERLKKEMEIARRIQIAIVPAAPEHDEFEIAVSMIPAEEVGGDYYDVLYDKFNNLWFAIGDVSGHGVTPGLIMMMAQSLFSAALHQTEEVSPKDAIIFVNKLLHNNITKRLNTDHFMTMTFLKYSGNGNFLYSGAHETMLVFRHKTNSCELIETKGMYLGVLPDIESKTYESDFSLNKGDFIVLYTDGVIEAMNNDHKLFELANLQRVVMEHADKTLEEIKMNILEKTLDWCNHKPKDDITLLLIRRK